MNSLKSYSLLIFITLILFSCNSTKIYVQNIKNAELKSSGIVYSLPKTVIVVELELSTVTKFRGPFCNYAEKYLGGAKDVIMQDEIIKQVSGINITSYAIPDTNLIFKVNYAENSGVYNINLCKNGLLAGINLTEFYPDYSETSNTESFINTDFKKAFSYSNYSLVPVLETKYDTLYKEVFVDSAYVKVPVVHKKLVNKSEETQAKELADQIFLLRDDKNALLKGENDGNIFPDGQALQVMLNELTKVENDYMSLFAGKIEESTRTYKFEFYPQTKDTIQEVELFRLSQKYGILPVGDFNGKPVTIRITPENFSKPVEKYSASKKNAGLNTTNSFVYRIPDQANVEILINSSPIARNNIQIAQYGSLNTIPAEIFKQDTQIEFFSEYGSIKSIKKKQ